MENFSNLISQRRSHRKFTEETVASDDVQKIMRAALMAPSSKGLHSYEFVTVTDPKVIGHLSRCKSMGADFVAGAPLVVVVLGTPETSDVWVEDASVAATMMMLQAEDLGLGACWVQVRERQDSEGRDAEENVKRLLGVPADKRVLCLVAIGHKGMERKPQNEERLKWDKVHTEQW